MDAAEYKLTTSSPDVFTRGDLTLTLTSLEAEELRTPVREALLGTPVPKPPLHAGSASSDYFRLALPVDTVDTILDQLLLLEAGAVSSDGETTPEASRLADLVNRWGRYRESIGRCGV
jgi:hypothetical protein